jgi:hypothetical protein
MFFYEMIKEKFSIDLVGSYLNFIEVSKLLLDVLSRPNLIEPMSKMILVHKSLS